MPVIPVSLSLWSATASAVHPADAKATHRWSLARLTRPLRSGATSRSSIASVHGVVGHFVFVPPPNQHGFLLARLEPATETTVSGLQKVDRLVCPINFQADLFSRTSQAVYRTRTRLTRWIVVRRNAAGIISARGHSSRRTLTMSRNGPAAGPCASPKSPIPAFGSNPRARWSGRCWSRSIPVYIRRAKQPWSAVNGVAQ
jgi:hypothetical protein